MSTVDKNKAVLKFLSDCPVIKDNPLFFNFAEANDEHNQYVTQANDVTLNKTFVDGSKQKEFTFTLLTFKSISNNAIIKEDSILNENIEDLQELQAIIDWVNDQSNSHNYPNFGEGFLIDDMRTTTDTPQYDGVNVGVSPALAMYSIVIRIIYIDYTNTLY